MRLRLLSKLVMSLSIAGLATSAVAASNNGGFNAQQQQQIQQIVHDYLLNNPQILIDMSQKLQQQQMQQQQQAQQKAQQVIPGIASQIFSADTSPVAGNPNGSVTLVEFFDYQCPHCKDMSAIVDNLLQQDSNLKVIFKEFPIFGANSQYAAKAALAAAKQGKYVDFHNALMQAPDPITNDQVLTVAQNIGLNIDQLKKDMDSKAVTQELNANNKLAQQLQLVGTPAFIISVTGNPQQSILVPGATTQDVLQGLISQAGSGKVAAANS